MRYSLCTRHHEVDGFCNMPLFVVEFGPQAPAPSAKTQGRTLDVLGIDQSDVARSDTTVLYCRCSSSFNLLTFIRSPDMQLAELLLLEHMTVNRVGGGSASDFIMHQSRQ